MATSSVRGLTVADSGHIEIHPATRPGPVAETMTAGIIETEMAIIRGQATERSEQDEYNRLGDYIFQAILTFPPSTQCFCAAVPFSFGFFQVFPRKTLAPSLFLSISVTPI
jgi:hypothetical protein